MIGENQQPLFSIIHFNDVYDIQCKKNGTAGICNFEVAIKKLKKKYPNSIVLFSGDAFSPSVLTNLYDGKQIVPALNKLMIDVACFGNHEFDLPMPQTLALVKQCNFPWLSANIRLNSTSQPLGCGPLFQTKKLGPLKIGFFAVFGEDWPGILSDQYEDQIDYEDAIQYAKKMTHLLRAQQECNFVVALTHQRSPQDEKLAQAVSQIDIILGGHDHIELNKLINKVPTVKSGDNFKKVGLIHVFSQTFTKPDIYEGHRYHFTVQVDPIPIASQEQIDKDLKKHVDECMESYTKNDRVVGYTDVDLNTIFKTVRTQESNYGNFLADLARFFYNSDCCVLNSGCIRNDVLIKKGKLKFSQVSNLINDALVQVEVPGKLFPEILEYSCSTCPDTYAGSFLLVSGLEYSFNCAKKPRVQQIRICGQPLDFDRIYTMTTKLYLSNGGDGYEWLKGCRKTIDQTMGIDTLRLILKFFKGEDKMTENDQHQEDSDEEQEELDEIPLEVLQTAKKVSKKVNRISSLRSRFVQDKKGKKFVSICPKLDGRIKMIQD